MPYGINFQWTSRHQASHILLTSSMFFACRGNPLLERRRRKGKLSDFISCPWGCFPIPARPFSSAIIDISFSTLKRISLASAADYTFSRFQGFRGLEFRLLRALYQISLTKLSFVWVSHPKTNATSDIFFQT